MAGDAVSAKLLLKAVDNKAAPKDDLKKEKEYCVRRLDKAKQRRDRHEEKGTQRLFRSRKELERAPRNVQAIEFNAGATLRADGTVRLPGGLVLKLTDRSWRPPENHEWTGAVQIVDTTRKVTSKTKPEHRKWVLHVALKRTDPAPVEKPSSRDEVIGVDAGCVNHITASDGRFMNMAAEKSVNERIKELQQARSRCNYSSRSWNRRNRKLQKLYASRTNRRDNSSRQIAAAIASTPGITTIAAEITNTKDMLASAAGTKEHPGQNVAAKRGLNRSLSNARFGGIRVDIQRACVKHGKLYVGVPAANTSSICNRCKATVARESQSSYHCSSCGIVGHADLNAAINVADLAWLRETQTSQALRDSASKEDRARGNLVQLQVAVPEVPTNKPGG